MRFVFLLIGTCLLGWAAAYAWGWYVGGDAYLASIVMRPSQLAWLIGSFTLLGSGLMAAGIGTGRQAGLEGFLCGLFIGPFGVIAAFFLDNRPKCPQCLQRVSVAATHCPHCQARQQTAEKNIAAHMHKRQEDEINGTHLKWMEGRNTPPTRKNSGIG